MRRVVIAWWQFLRGYIVSWKIPEESAFMAFAVPCGWRRRPLIRIRDRYVSFVYPLTRDATFRKQGRVE
jgi:hypothetical protein